MWVVEFTDGTALSQFDPETGEENKGNPDWLPSAPNQPAVSSEKIWLEKRIKRFGWYPFNPQLAARILAKTKQIVIPTENPSHVIELIGNEKVVAFRENSIRYGAKSGRIKGREIIYVLGKYGEPLTCIDEGGAIIGTMAPRGQL